MKNTSVLKIAESLGALSSRWLKRDFPFRKKAVKRLIEKSRFTPKMAEALLDSIFSELTAPKLKQLLRSELGNPRYLDGFQKNAVADHMKRANGPGLITHIFAANVPNPAITSFILGMLVKARNAGKVSSRDAGFLDIYLASLKKHDPVLSKGQSVISISGLKASLAESDAVVVYGSDETVAHFKKIAPIKAAFSGYGHRVSFSILLKEALSAKTAAASAKDVWMLDQRGCLSPTVIYVEAGEKAAQDFGRTLSRELKRQSGRQWFVFVQEKSKPLPLNCGSRVIYVRPFKNIREVYGALKPFQKYLQCAALEGPASRRLSIAQELSCLGVNRVTRAGRMQLPPAMWMHDGRPNLSDWLRWTDLE